MRLVFASCLAAFMLVSGERLPPAAAAEPATDNAAMTKILGSGGADAWSIKPARFTVSPEPALVPSGAAVTLESKSPQKSPTEYFFAFRLKASEAGPADVRFQMASSTGADKKPQGLSFSVRAVAAQPHLSYSTSVVGAKLPPAQNGVQHLVAVTDRSLGWPEDLRRTVEAEAAATKPPQEMLFTARCTVERNRFRTWLNGRFVGELDLDAGTTTEGTLRITLSPRAELVSVRGQQLSRWDAFELISIAGNLTGSMLHGKKAASASSPPVPFPEGIPQGVECFDDIPFEFTRPAASSNDHTDVGTSWARFGALPGFFTAHSGQFGGRWTSADRLDPSRICTYVPKGRYKALHLLAIADDRKDGVPIVTAQFYRPNAGHPINFSAIVPTDAGDGKGMPVRLADGTTARLKHVVIPLDPDAFSWFADLPKIGLEMTKEVKYYRGYPDPLEYSWHGGGLPSSVQIYGMTLERCGVDVEIQPEKVGHIWTAPESPRYVIQLSNRTGKAINGSLTVSTRSNGGQGQTLQRHQVELPRDGTPARVPLVLKPSRYGLHELTVSLKAGGEESTFHRNFAYLHENTRDQTPWEEGRGSIFGFWAWNGAHVTPKAETEIAVMAAAGAETSTSNYSAALPEVRALAEKHHFISEAAFAGGVIYYNGFYSFGKDRPKFDPAKPEESGAALVEAIKKLEQQPSAISRPTFVPFFAEPQIGNITTGIWPAHYGEDYKLTEAEQQKLQELTAKFVAGARAIRKQWPNYKLLCPYGDPMNTAMLLKFSPETRDLIDGCALDLPGFERLPEQQINQVTLNRLYTTLKDIRQYKPNPYLTLVEGFCVSSTDIDTGQQEQADISIRNLLLLMGYGITRFESPNAPFDCAGYWGENHYGGGWCTRLPLAMPKLAYVHYATLTRHLNRANFSKYVPTGSTSTFCEQFKHYKTGKLIHVMWTVRGKRPVTVKVSAGAMLELYDANDNVTTLKEKDGVVSFTLDQSPQYLEGLDADAQIMLGDADHSDTKPSAHAKPLAKLGGGAWHVTDESPEEYTKNKPLQIERFPAKMTATPVDAAPSAGGRALAIHLPKPEKDRGVMPFFTTLAPKEPLTVPGKASHLGMWVRAASDWGRVVYLLRDAKGEKWISVGAREQWNNDDMHGWSAFCFDGWRYLRFPLPGNLPYDCYREPGSSWWGSFGGDGIVDLPLKLERVIVERRPKVIYGGQLVDAKPDDVLLGDLYAEYAAKADQADEAVRLSKLRTPVPQDAPAMSNPIAEMQEKGTGAPTKAIRVTDPIYQYDGTRCNVHFEPVEGAKSYDIWVSPYADGRGALKLGKAWKESGQLLQGLRPDTQFYLFVVYTDSAGKMSKPSAPLAFTLKDRFGYK